MTQPTTTDVHAFGVKEYHDASTLIDKAAEDVTLIGYTIIRDVLTDGQLQSIRKKLDAIYERQVTEVGGEEQLHQINDAFTVRCPLAYDDEFLEVATQRAVLAVVEKLLGDYYTLMLQNGILNYPAKGTKQNAGAWHRDLNYQHFTSSRPLSISALFCIDPFSQETGGTQVLPASHKTEKFPSPDYIRSHGTVVNATAGSVLVFDSMMFHRGGLNTSPNVRRAINHMYTLPFVKPQISFPRVLDGKFSDDAFLRKFLGYESEPGENVPQWRQTKIAQAQARTKATA
jgi:ectoine hydroxylase-related dioxygenase (phytanoyl-CoA dioxygenase family)